MFDIGGGELLVIGIVALVVIGPKELPGLIRTAGNAMSKVRRMAAEFRGQFDEAMREAELDQAKKAFADAADLAQSVKPAFNPLDTIRNEIQSVKDEIQAAKTTTVAPLSEPKVEPPPAAPPIDITAEVARQAAAAPSPAPAPLPKADTAPVPAPAPEPERKPKRPRKKPAGEGASA
jgi:sec-independent protein translocase protein TatB